jgi:hypothetical protein
VETVETCNKEEEISKKLVAVLVPYKVGTPYHYLRIL